MATPRVSILLPVFDAGRWFTAEEAKQYGLVDSVILRRGEMA